MMHKFLFVSILTFGMLGLQGNCGEEYVPETDQQVLTKLTEWQDLKFGLMIHWGPYSQWGVVESWSLCSEDEPWCRRNDEDYARYKRNYENLKSTFNPTRFAPEMWAEAARAAGMRYLVFTTKHHDGFSMFDTRLTDYRITDPGCPFSRSVNADVTAALFDSFRKRGFMIGAYFSKPDWHSQVYWWSRFATPDRNVNYEIARYPDRWRRFIDFTHGQIGELLTRYSPIDILWLDGGWVQPLTDARVQAMKADPGYRFQRIQSQDIEMERLVGKARQLQPGLIVVDRAVPGPFQNYLTPEARVPETQLPYPWETCMPMATSWSHVPGDTYKNVGELIRMLVDIVVKGGNLLLNIGPDANGEWDAAAYDRLRGIGAWMKVNGGAIYGARPLPPYQERNLRFATGPEKKIHVFYICAEDESRLPAAIHIQSFRPASGATIRFLGKAERLAWRRRGQGFSVSIPERLRVSPPGKYVWTLEISPPKA